MHISQLLKKALDLQFLTVEEGLFLYKNALTSELSFVANEIRKKLVPGNNVTWMIDRNVNITNVCSSQCSFCNFYIAPNNSEGKYITTIDEYKFKIEELFSLGGNQVLLQGGLHPKLDIIFYENLFSELKQIFPALKLHALGPPEIHYISKISRLSYEETLTRLIKSGLDSLPGAGAEILTDRVRKILSPAKCKSGEWLEVMRVAHQMNLPTSATMMFGHVETLEERIIHMYEIRSVQSEKAKDNYGFIAFIPWPFQGKDTRLSKTIDNISYISADEYIRTIAMSRIMLPNITNIQASWLTVGKSIAQLCLHSGANDLGSIMIEENVVSAAGASFKMNAAEMQKTIEEAGFIPQKRNQKYEYVYLNTFLLLF